MAKIDCNSKLREAFPDLKDSQLKAIQEELGNLRSKLFRPGTKDFNAAEFRQNAQKLLDQRRFAADALKKEAAFNFAMISRNMDFIKQPQFQGDPVEAIRALISGGEARAAWGANQAIDRQAGGMARPLQRSLILNLDKEGVAEHMGDGAMDREAAQELYELRTGGSPGSTKNTLAQKAAQVIGTVNDMMLRNKQMAGSAVQKLQGFITHTIHSAEALKEAGFEQWFTLMAGVDGEGHGKGYLDLDRSFGVMQRDQIQAEMFRDYNNIVSGKRTTVEPGEQVSDDFTSINERAQNLGQRMAQSRTYHFKDGYSWADYNKVFGQNNLMESVLSDIENSSKQTMLMRQFGTKPDAGFAGLLQRTRDYYSELGDKASVEKLAAGTKSLTDEWSALRGKTDVPGVGIAAAAVKADMAIQTMSKLGAAYPRAIRDLAPSAFILRSVNGENVLSNTANILGEYISNIKDSEMKGKVGDMFSLAESEYRGALFDTFGANSADKPGAISGTISTMQRAFSKASFLPAHFSALRASGAAMVGKSLAENAHLGFSDLGWELKQTLERYAMGPREWDMLRQAVDTHPKGYPVIDVKALRELPVEVFGNERAKFDMEVKSVGMFNDLADLMTNTHNNRQKSMVLGGTTMNEASGLLRRLIMQFKAPMLQELNTMKRVTMSTPEAPTSLSDAMMSKSGASTMASFIAMSTVLGYAGSSIVDLAKGRSPKDPHDLETWKDALVRGGGMGIYGDFLAGEANRTGTRSLLHTLAGPSLSELDNVYSQIYAPALRGETKQIPQHAFNLAAQNTPFHNLWYTKGALDYLVLDKFNEYLNPGYSRRLENSVESHGQNQFMFKPTGSGILGR
jgi:hypothetical protein